MTEDVIVRNFTIDVERDVVSIERITLLGCEIRDDIIFNLLDVTGTERCGAGSGNFRTSFLRLAKQRSSPARRQWELGPVGESTNRELERRSFAAIFYAQAPPDRVAFVEYRTAARDVYVCAQFPHGIVF